MSGRAFRRELFQNRGVGGLGRVGSIEGQRRANGEAIQGYLPVNPRGPDRAAVRAVQARPDDVATPRLTFVTLCTFFRRVVSLKQREQVWAHESAGISRSDAEQPGDDSDADAP